MRPWLASVDGAVVGSGVGDGSGIAAKTGMGVAVGLRQKSEMMCCYSLGTSIKRLASYSAKGSSA